MYIHAPITPRLIYISKTKIPRAKPAKRNDVPPAYRKKRFVDHLADALVYVAGFEEMCKSLIRKGIHHDN